LVQPIDAIDNGVSLSDPLIKDVYPYDVGMILDSFKPTWKERSTSFEGF